MIERLYETYIKNQSISTDTRKIKPGSIFFALKGPNFDANQFAAEALNAGAELCVVDDPRVVKNQETYLLVEDVLTTLQDLARYHRAQLTIPIIGLTGSNGKTTSKELIAAALSKKYKIFSTQGNLNNHIGVPLSMLAIKAEHEIAVIEMGANHVGEIGFLCTISKPTHGFITNIGKAHLEGFGGVEGIIRGKSELYQHLINYNGVVWINSNSSILSNMAKRFKNPLFYPNAGDYYHAELIEANPEITFKAENGEVVKTQLPGAYNFENMAVALCIAKYFEVDPVEANAAIAAYVSENNRSQLVKKGSNAIILDAYNANPTSMKNAVDNLAAMDAGKKIAILGDMNELGADSDMEHEELGKLLSQSGIDEVFLCGRLIQPAMKHLPHAKHFETRDELTDYLKKNKIQEATILIKASRSIGLEKVMEFV